MPKHVINNPGGRKPLPEDEVLGTSITVRYTAKQMKRLNRKAGDMPIRTYIRESSLSAVVRPPVSKAMMTEIRNLNNLGTNINELAKAANTYGFPSIAQKCSEAAEEILTILHEARLKIKPSEEGDAALLKV